MHQDSSPSFQASVASLQRFLTGCDSVSMAMGLGGAIQALIDDGELRSASKLDSATLQLVKQKLYQGPAASLGADDALFSLLADSSFGRQSNSSEQQIQFVEAVERQIVRSEPVNFQVALTEVSG